MAQVVNKALLTGKASKRSPRILADVSKPLLEEVIPPKAEAIPVASPAKVEAAKTDVAKTDVAKPTAKGDVTDDLPAFSTVTKETKAAIHAASLSLIMAGMDDAKYNAFLDEIYTASNSLTDKVAIAATLAVIKAVKTGNIHFARKLLQALGSAPKGDSKTMFRTNQLKAWFINQGPFQWDDTQLMDYVTGQPLAARGLIIDSAKVKTLRKQQEKSPQSFASKMLEVPFWVYKPEATYKGFDLIAELKALQIRAQKEGIKHANDPKLKLEGLAAVTALVNNLTGNKPNMIEDNSGADETIEHQAAA